MFSQLPIVDQFRVRNALNDLQDAVKQYRDKRERQLQTVIRDELQDLADAVLCPDHALDDLPERILSDVPRAHCHDDLELLDPIGSMTVGDDDDLRLNLDPDCELVIELNDKPIKRDLGIGDDV